VVGVLLAHGDHFTAGLDLAQVASPTMKSSNITYPKGSVDP
jgi:hypothetical protein